MLYPLSFKSPVICLRIVFESACLRKCTQGGLQGLCTFGKIDAVHPHIHAQALFLWRRPSTRTTSFKHTSIEHAHRTSSGWRRRENPARQQCIMRERPTSKG